MSTICFMKNDAADEYSLGIALPYSVSLFDTTQKIADLGDVKKDYSFLNQVTSHYYMNKNAQVDLSAVEKSNMLAPLVSQKWANAKVSLEIGFNFEEESEELLQGYELFSKSNDVNFLLYDGKQCLVSITDELITFEIRNGCAINIAAENPYSLYLDRKIIAALTLALVSDVTTVKATVVLSQGLYNALAHNEPVTNEKPEAEKQEDYFDAINRIFKEREKMK